ncbi:ArsR/SmtB family transcription factor [Aerococcaceae bacterium WGS1372]
MTQYKCMDDMTIEQELDKVNNIIETELIESKANIFKILGDLNRIKIVELLAHYNKLCVYEISQFIDASVATTSHHLITLRNSGVITSEKHGKRVVYALDNQDVLDLLEIAKQVSKDTDDKITV